jgi:hypothetical protein
MFIGNEKKKKRGGYAIAIGALAMYGAYRLIAGMKTAILSGTSGMMRAMKKMKKKTVGDCSCMDSMTDMDCDSECEPYD